MIAAAALIFAQAKIDVGQLAQLIERSDRLKQFRRWEAQAEIDDSNVAAAPPWLEKKSLLDGRRIVVDENREALDALAAVLANPGDPPLGFSREAEQVAEDLLLAEAHVRLADGAALSAANALRSDAVLLLRTGAPEEDWKPFFGFLADRFAGLPQKADEALAKTASEALARPGPESSIRGRLRLVRLYARVFAWHWENGLWPASLAQAAPTDEIPPDARYEPKRDSFRIVLRADGVKSAFELAPQESTAD